MARMPRITVEIGPAEAIADLLVGLEALVERNRDGDGEDVLLAVDDLLTAYRRSGPTISTVEHGPRTWHLPEEPGPEVTAVRDADGDLWRRAGRGWSYTTVKGDASRAAAWCELFLYGPLTDATAKVPS